jgi:magnesium chelatase subunit D
VKPADQRPGGGAAQDPWAAAARAAAVIAVDAAGVGGASVRAMAGPVRDRWLALLRGMLPAAAPLRRVPLGVADARLLGGLDLAATLRAGRPVAERGLLAEADGGVAVLAMAERLSEAAAARFNQALDQGEVFAARDGMDVRSPARLGVVALDEGMAEDERPPASLLDRLAFLLDFQAISPRAPMPPAAAAEEIAAARALLPSVSAGADIVEALCGAAMALGVASIRAPLIALRVARINAALAGRTEVSTDDAGLAARLVLAPRATVLPAPPPPAPPEDEPPEEEPPQSEPPESESPAGAAADESPEDRKQPEQDPTTDDLVLAAAMASIPPDLLARLFAQARAPRTGTAGRSGAAQKSGARGRPAGVKAGEPRRGARLNLVETLRAAAPWQTLRKAGPPASGSPRIAVRQEDFRVTRHEQRSETTIIFVVDASRSSAVNRLAEAKGAVEMLLADCYARRDRVAVLAFRGRGAELLLPPTRSLVRAKRQLAGLPGGGGTPLAAGLDAAAQLADAVRRRGDTAAVVLLTDGRANVTRDGSTGRARAEADAMAAGRALREAGVTALLVDTAPRPQPMAAAFAREMGAGYLPLPYASAATLSTAVRSATAAPAGAKGRRP